MSEINPISNYNNFPDPIKPQADNAPEASNKPLLNAHLQKAIDQTRDLISQFQKTPTRALKLKIEAVLGKICDFLQNRGSELKAECKANGWSDEGEEGYSHFIEAAMKQYDNFHNPQNPTPIVSLEQFNTYLTQLHFLATNKP